MKQIALLSFILITCISCDNYDEIADNNGNDRDYALTELLSCSQLLDTTDMNLYPFIPFTEKEWSEMTYSEKLAKRQLPENQLAEMNTLSLFYQVVYCELSQSMFVYNTMQAGFRAVVPTLNMMQELMRRSDTGICLLEIAEKMELSDVTQGECFKFYSYLQIFLAQKETVANLSTQETKRLAQYLQQQQKTIINLSKEESTIWEIPASLTPVLFAMGNILLQYEYEPFLELIKTNEDVDAFMMGEHLRNTVLISLIEEQLQHFLLTFK